MNTLEANARAVARKVRGRFPSAFAAVDVSIPRRRPPWGGPMNGQRGRQDIVRTLIGLRPPTAVLETGTNLGTSTEYFAYLTGAPVWTCESQSVYYKAAQRKFRDNDSIHIWHGNSVDFLKQAVGDASIPKNDVLFYLDAHWESYLPLREEVQLVTEHWQDPWILIDDFQVADDPGYVYADYGPGAALVLDYLERDSRWVPLYPAIRSADETGSKTGSVLLVPHHDVDRVVATGLLRRPT
jgi:hypothetical protein